MNKKYLNFSLILIVLSVFDVITTQYALSTYPHLSEGNPIMALVTSSFALFVLMKAIGVLVIVNIYRRIKAQSETASKVGQTVIILMMLFVVGNNCVQIASASVSYYYVTPNSMEYPGRPEIDGSNSYAFLETNGSQINEILQYNGTTGELIYSLNNRIYGSAGTLKFAVADWVNPNRIYFVDSSKNVLYTDSTIAVNLSKGYKTYGANPDDCPTCDDIYKIGVVATLNTIPSGYVDSNGDLFLADGNAIVTFTKTLDFTKSTYITVSGYTASTYSICASSCSIVDEVVDLKLGSTGLVHVLVAGYGSAAHGSEHPLITTRTSHLVYQNKALIHNEVVHTSTYFSSNLFISTVDNRYAKINLPDSGNMTRDIVLAQRKNVEASTANNNPTYDVSLRYFNSTYTEICPTNCAGMTGLNGLQILNGFAYLASSAQNYIYRYPTTITVSSGTGYVPGIGTESTDLPDITYTEKSINSLYANYYNTSKFVVQVKINFASGNWPTSVNYGINDQAYRWQIKLIDPNGVTVNSWDTGGCDDSGITHCELSILQEYSPPSIGWQAGTWYVKLYEHKIDSTLFGDAPSGNLALLTTSATWNVLNSSTNTTGTINDPVESINSPSNLATITLIDNYVGLLGFGINSTSKLLFSLLIIVILFIVGLIYAKNGMIGFALASIPYVFFTYISYIPKWIFIIYIITLIIVAKVFR